jgi:hypothetical protein
LTTKSDRMQVQLKFGNATQTFEGTAEEIWLLLQKCFSQLLPTFEVAQKLALNVDVAVLARDCEGLVAFSPEGPALLVPRNKLTDNENLALWLLAAYLGNKLNPTKNDALSKEELAAKLGKSTKIASTRLGELVKADWAAKTADDKFRLTTFGVSQMQKDVLPRIIAKTGI